ncbi:TraR/DksA family transcriptional regulator [Vulgatibacter incomptus]|uniref:C4-type zinc finger protein, DksA/TraR family n=1 Tax=Vulgatibacter incomptus TaxID=1391653 RepID=A0A0K1PHB6_9BACT|nr:TraR/DksA family transcriptional regulator [Vulgatibacter incomptus]AKU92933.1 C4-type zinc finger protein, DksA/TraR family [Vulgatibacter incomptus]
MKKPTLARHQKSLLALRDELVRGSAASVRRENPEAGADEDEAPLAEMLQVIASNRNQSKAGELARIDAALKRLEENPDDFGLCVECEDEIAPGRLAAMPFVELCVDCQAKRDSPRGGARRHLTDYR